jgi:hypothetical protein
MPLSAAGAWSVDVGDALHVPMTRAGYKRQRHDVAAAGTEDSHGYSLEHGPGEWNHSGRGWGHRCGRCQSHLVDRL